MLELTTEQDISTTDNPVACIQCVILKYLDFLNEKNAVKNYQIEKSVARTLFMDEFKPKNNIKNFSFSTMYRVMLEFGLIDYKSRRSDVIKFKADLYSYAIRYYNDDLKNEPSTSSNQVKAKTSKKSKTSIIFKCNICKYTCSSQSLLDKHEASERHLERIKFANGVEEQDQKGVIIEVKDGYGSNQETVIARLSEKYEISIKILNKTADIYLIENIKEIEKTDSVALQVPTFPCVLNSASKHILKATVNFSDSTYFTYPLLVKLRNMKTAECVEIIKKIMFHVHSDLVDDLHATKPYNGFVKPNIRDSDYEVIPGIPPPSQTNNPRPAFKLPQYLLPHYIGVLLEHDFKESEKMSSVEKNMLVHILHEFASYSRNGTLDINNYFNISQLRLFMEEYQMRIDIRLYDVDNQLLTTAATFPKNYLELSVPGLAEHRPSLLKGDSVYVQENKENKIKYEGKVHKVNQSSVILGFNQRFLDNVHLKNKKYSVSFGFNRVPLRTEHQAIHLAKKHDIIPLLCPTVSDPREVNNYNIKWYDVANNENQKFAVQHILSETARPLPYLIFGPPGTGKTVTVVEAILQVIVHKPTKRILVCAPSNFAADEITKRLVQKGLSKVILFRYVAPSYSYDLIDTFIKPFTNFKNEFYHPPINELNKYFVIVTTLVTASRLVNGGVPPGHFSYVFIDESGQATESETLIPIAGILSNAAQPGTIDGQIVLAGDPQQLGPIIHSQRSNSFGYGMSMLERLMKKCPLYSKTDDGYPDHLVTKLLQSYRSHPAILELPNRLFYDGELIPPQNTRLTHVAVGWEELPNKNFPVLFHSVIGKDDREANSPSFFNLQEVDVVATYLQKLIGSRLKGMKIEENHIGVITPYRKQVHKLQAVCKKRKWNKLMVGSVEQFQGQERLIIIVTTVRSRPEFTTHDEKFHLGFLKNPKRFNVAITRAKALLIVIGNPNLLHYDEYWRKFIQYCVDNNSFVGSPFQPPSEAIPIAVEVNGEENDDSANFSRGIVWKYLYFLNEKKVVKKFKINKNLARDLFMEEFKPTYEITKFPFSNMIRVMFELDLTTYTSQRSVVIKFNPDMYIIALQCYIENMKNDLSIHAKPCAPKIKAGSTDTSGSVKLICNLCNYIASKKRLMNKHEVSEKHLQQLRFANNQGEQNGRGVTMEVQAGNGGKPETVIVRHHEACEVVVTIINRNSYAYTIEDIKEVVKSKSIILEKPPASKKLNPSSKEILKLKVTFNDWTYYNYTILMKLRNVVTRKPLQVVKEIMLHAHSDLVDNLHAIKPYVKVLKPNIWNQSYQIIPGVPPPKQIMNAGRKLKLLQYPLPNYMKTIIDNDFNKSSIMSTEEKKMLNRILNDFASYSKKETLNVKNYFNISQLRLYMEEYQMKINIRSYDMNNQVLTASSPLKNCLELSVPGLAEHRPSLLKGDSVYVQENPDSKIKYEGKVHQVHQTKVKLGFDERFVEKVHVKNKKYSVSFDFNRGPLRAEHQAINLAKNHEIIPILCPTFGVAGDLISYPIKWFNAAANEKQKTAVKHILSETARPLPYLIFGPPGTGKTATVIEAILQIRARRPSKRILVCTPSNFAADEIMKRLIKNGLSKMELFRYVAPSQSSDLIESSIKPYTNLNVEFYHPPIDKLLKYIIIVTTIVNAARLVNGGTPASHFSYVFIDESGQATESETLIPIAGILSSAATPGAINGQIVLAGDPQQLGPVIHSQKSIAYGYGMSMLERLMTKCSFYTKSNGTYPTHFVTKLIESYRSHPKILELPNRLFYEGELIPPENKQLTHVAVGWEELPNKNFPILFHSVVGKEQREEDSPSYFNLQEVDVVANYVEKLIGSRLQGMKIEEDHIGIITPYRNKQVHKIKTACSKKRWNKLKIGSVEKFQGQESLIIIVSTVRSRPDVPANKEKYYTGFLKNPKRFNVTVTRAKALIIVVGNPNILQHDTCWGKFIEYCRENKSMRGTQFFAPQPIPVEANDEENDDGANFSRGNI
ncbi:hypothetical protein FQR65_LT02351 [Abscondita terminalis]|nr:hypothetical protein FQR65_LT02351 [Abscondita terminalis]